MEEEQIEIIHKFEPLFEIMEDSTCYPDVSVVIITGGRYSFKSFTLAIFALRGAFLYGWRVLYSRFTNTSIGDSIKAEVSDKIELLGFEDEMEDTRNAIRMKDETETGYITFKGIKAGSKGQTANLKSLSGFNIWVIDEAEETPDFKTFEKVFLSIRSNKKRNLAIMILNPTLRTHWIYKWFFERKKIKDGFNGIVDNVMYIHTSYLDGDQSLIPKNILDYYNKLKEDDPEEYDNIVLGGWKKQLDGVLFPIDDLNYYDSLPTNKRFISKISFIDVADEGDDYHSVPIGLLYDDGSIYIDDLIFTQESMSTNAHLTADILDYNKVEYCRVETNFGGSAYMIILQPLLKTSVSLLPARATSNKHARILNSQYRVKKKVFFKKKYSEDSEYSAFMNNIFEYMKDGSSEHDDAPDSIEGLLQLAQSLFPHLYE